MHTRTLPVNTRTHTHTQQVGIFFGAVVRGDLNKIRIGGYSVILDRAVVHAAKCVGVGCVLRVCLHPACTQQTLTQHTQHLLTHTEPCPPA